MKTYTIGCAEIAIGAIAEDGGMGATLASLGYTYQDTAKLSTEDPEVQDYYAEEVDDPVAEITKAGKTVFTWSLMNPDVEALAAVLGGTADAANNTWDAPDDVPSIEKSLRVKPKQGLTFEMPRVKIRAKINGDFSKKGILLVEITATVLQPTKENTKKMHVSLVTA